MSTGRVDWEEAGRGWGARATEWAYLWEPYALPANEVLLDRLGVDAGVRLLDIACGSGFAASVAARRAPWSQGSMRQNNSSRLPRLERPVGAFGPETCSLCLSRITASTSPPVSTVSGRGVQGALEEARRGPVPEGRLGLTFWGRFERLGLMPYFLKVIE